MSRPLEIMKKGRSQFEICPICGHENWCCEINDTHPKYGPSVYIICKRDMNRMDTAEWKYIGDTSNGNAKYVLKKEFSGKVNYQASGNKKEIIIPRFPDTKLDILNRQVLSMLTLEDYHRRKLNADGINDEMVERWNIKSFPPPDKERYEYKLQSKNPFRWEIAQELFKKNGDLTGFPGAYKNKKGEWRLAGPVDTGIVFGIPNVYDEYVMLQIRLDNPPPKKGKYRMLSSDGFDSGCTPSSRIGIVKPKNHKDYYCFYVTEGIKKAIVAAERLGAVIATVQGVGSWSELLDKNERGSSIIAELKLNFGVKIGIVAYDHDKYQNSKVMEQQGNIIAAIRDEGIYPAVAEWDSYCGKGLDDMLNNGYHPRYYPI